MQRDTIQQDRVQHEVHDKADRCKINPYSVQHFRVQRQVYGYLIEACMSKMEQDIHILLTGGILPHTGAVSIFEDGKEAGSIQLNGHKDGTVSSRWGKELSGKFRCRVTVACGIHYDHASGEMIREIIRHTDDMLEEVIGILGGGHCSLCASSVTDKDIVLNSHLIIILRKKDKKCLKRKFMI